MVRDETVKVARRSSIWLYFSKDHRRDLAQCIICGNFLSTRGGSSSNLTRHLRSKHKKIKLHKGRSTTNKDAGAKEENVEINQIEEQNILVLENFEGENLNEIIIPEGTEMEIELEGKIETLDEDSITVWNEAEPVETTVTTTISPQTRENTSKKCKQRTGLYKRVTDLKKSNLLLKRRSDKDISNKKVEALILIAHNLGRMATSFEIIADCLRTNQQNQKSHSNTEIISKLNDILQILKRNNTQHDGQQSADDIVNEINKNVSPILRTLNLLPKFSKIPKIINKSAPKPH